MNFTLWVTVFFAFAKFADRVQHPAGWAHLEVDVAALEHAADVGLVGGSAFQPLEGGGFVAEGFEEGVGEGIRMERLSARRDTASSISTAFMGQTAGVMEDCGLLNRQDAKAAKLRWDVQWDGIGGIPEIWHRSPHPSSSLADLASWR
jgi:hypothetical protein